MSLVGLGLARHRTWRSLPLWALATGFNTSALLGFSLWHASTEGTSVSTTALTLTGWVGVAIYLAFTDVRTRCTPFEMSLPVPARNLWLSSLMSTLAGGLIIVGLTVGVIALRAAVPTRARVELHVGILALTLCAGLLLAALLLRIPRPKLSRIPITPGQIVWTVCVLVGATLLMALAARAGWPGPVALAAAAAALALWSYRSVPPSFALAPFETESARAVAPASVGRAPSAWLLPLTVARTASAGAKELAAVPFILLFAFALGNGLMSIGGDMRELRYFYLPMTAYMLFALTGPRLASLHHLDPLPISRRRLAAALVLPYFLVLCVGYVAGDLTSAAARSRTEYVNFEEGEDGYSVTVPLRVYALSTDGEAPPVGSPWGESQPSAALPLFGWSRLSVYSPYAAPPGSSREFVALQISRAVEAAYGVSLAPEVIDERYLTTDADGRVVPRGDGLTLRADNPGMAARSGPMFPVLVTVVALPWLLLTALLLRTYRPRVREWARQAIYWGSLAGLLAFAIGTSLASIFGDTEPWAMRALVQIPVMRLGRTPLGPWGAWVGAVLLLGAAYGVVQRQFLRMEIPTRPARYSLICSRQD